VSVRVGTSRAAALCAALALTAACGSAAGSAAAPPVADGHPSQLVGLWSTVGPTVPSGTVLKLTADREMFLFSACGAPFGFWRAVPSGAMNAVLMVAAPDCPAVAGDDEWERSTPPWLRSVSAFRSTGSKRLLLDAAGRTLAELTPTDTAPGPAIAGERVPPDPPTAEQMARLDSGGPPPAGLRAAVPTDLTGRWIPTPAASGAEVYVQFAENRSVKLFDGCNWSRGRWTMGPDGAFAAVLYLSYVLACANAPVADWLQNAAWTSFDGADLVFTDATGARLGALHRVAETATAPPPGG
jgi:hypothetical protein